MTLKASTGLRNALLATGSLKATLDGGRIDIYGGSVPATADAAVGAAVLLCSITVNGTGTGITFGATPAGGTLSKASTEVWSGVNAASGTATFCRHVLLADDGTESATAPRLQGSVGVAGAFLNLSNAVLPAGAPQTIDYYTVALPTL